MTVAPEIVPFSELLRAPNETVERLRRVRSVRLRRRDADDLMLMSAARAEQEDELVELSARLLALVLRRDEALVRELLPVLIPWAHFLPAKEIRQLADEFVVTAAAAADLDNWSSVSQLLTEWRHTAEIYSDPELHAALTTRPLDDFGPVPRPEMG